MKDKALKLALEALERGETELRWKAITIVKEALAQPERTWVGLTDEEIETSKPPLSNDAVVWELAVEWANKKLMEKNKCQ